MKKELFDYDVYPKAVAVGKRTELHIVPLGEYAAFKGGVYTVRVYCLTNGGYAYPERGNCREYEVAANNGALAFEHTFDCEGEHFVRVYNGDNRLVQLSVYAVGDKLIGCYPYIGDMHMHSCRSDGRQSPEVMPAIYRSYGYDFMALTDHGRYYPSLEAMSFWQDTGCGLSLVTGEEIHLPGNDIHIVNFGGASSINALLECSAQNAESPDKGNALSGYPAPVPLTVAQYESEVRALAATLDIPEGVEEFTYAACVWIFNHIRACGGLGIFCHPCWINDLFQVPENIVELMMERAPFDAFEVLGGENYYEHNGFQTAHYHDDRAKGRRYPVVGSTDTHNAYHTNIDNCLAATMVFAPSSSREDIIAAVKDFRSAAIDRIMPEPRVVGEGRLVRYAWFLLENYFPLHDEICREEGRLMRRYAVAPVGEKAQIAEDIRRRSAEIAEQRAKYFAF